ncbi:MAG: TPM domain-containing protein [Casimicrobiaceae bacterium]
MFLSAVDSQAIEQRVHALERAIGIQVVTMVVGKCDVYPETVWKAFALGSSLAALAVAVGDVLHPEWMTSTAVMSSIVSMLAIGALCALASIYIPGFARLFLRDARAAVEASQYAKVQFLDRQMFATRERTAILVLVAMLERRVVILTDTGLRDAVTVAEWDAVIATMTERLRAGAACDALLAGLDAIGNLLATKGVVRGDGNAFADVPIELGDA